MKRPSSLQRPLSPLTLGDPGFWSVVAAIGAENAAARQPYKTDAQWQRMFDAASAAVERGVGLPDFVLFALVKQRRRNDEARALGISEAQQYRDTVAAERAVEAEKRARVERDLAEMRERLEKMRPKRRRVSAPAAWAADSWPSEHEPG